MLWRHLAVTDGYTGIGYVTLDHALQLGERGDAVAHDIDLSVATHLEIDGFGDDFARKCAYLGLDRVAVGGWGLYHAEVAGSHERELQGARYWGGGKGQRVDVGLHLAQLLLDAHAELLLFVDDEQAKIVKFHALANQTMGAYEDIDFACAEVFEELARLLGRTCAAEVVYAYGHVFETVGEGVPMLVCQYCGGYEYRCLLAVDGGFECCSYGYLGLAKSYISADESVHGACTLHVGFYFLCGFQLVGGVFVDEGGFELVLQVIVGREAESFLLTA